MKFKYLHKYLIVKRIFELIKAININNFYGIRIVGTRSNSNNSGVKKSGSVERFKSLARVVHDSICLFNKIYLITFNFSVE